MEKIRNIIFDLGGVILNIDLKRTELAFAGLGIGNFNEYYTVQTNTPLFNKLEAGSISPETFYSEFRKLAGLELTDEQIMKAWNALLVNFPGERIDWLTKIRTNYKIYLLSNTKEIHYNAFTSMFEEQVGNGKLNDLFIKTYYSHQIGLRKPATACYELVLKNEHLIAAETLFIDDSLPNVEAAKQTGMQAIHLPSPHTVLELNL